MAYTHHQKRVIHHILDVGRKKGASRKDLLSALETGIVESNLSNPHGGDADSQGWRQERAQFYKNPTNIRASAARFYDELKGAGGGTAGQRAAAVQRPAAQYRGRYDQARKQAEDILHAYDQGHFGKGGGGKRELVPGSDVGVPGLKLQLADREQTDTKRAVIDSVLAGQSGRQGKTFAQDIIARLTSGQYSATVPGAEIKVAGVKADPRYTGGAVGAVGAAAGSTARSPDAPNSLGRMIRIAEAQSAKAKPYAWGGGHGGTPAKVGTPVDCSGYVSMILGISPQTSGGLMNWGKPGKGKHVTVWTNQKHVIIQIGNKWYATSGENPGGGAGRRSKPSRAELADKVARHPRGL